MDEKNVNNVWGVMATIIFIIVVFLAVFLTTVDWGKSAPSQIQGIQQQVEDAQN